MQSILTDCMHCIKVNVLYYFSVLCTMANMRYKYSVIRKLYCMYMCMFVYFLSLHYRKHSLAVSLEWKSLCVEQSDVNSAQHYSGKTLDWSGDWLQQSNTQPISDSVCELILDEDRSWIIPFPAKCKTKDLLETAEIDTDFNCWGIKGALY